METIFPQTKVITRFKKIHGDRYDYSKVDYRGATEKVTIICDLHGEFEQSPHNHTRKRSGGCQECRREHSRQLGMVPKIHSFTHLFHGEFTGTVREICETFPICGKSAYKLVSGEKYICKGWVLTKTVRKRETTPPNTP